MALLRGGIEQLSGTCAVLLDAFALGQHDGKRERPLKVSKFSRSSIPFRRQHQIGLNAEAFLVETPDQCRSLRLARFRAFGCEFKRGQIATLIEGVICRIGAAALLLHRRGGERARAAHGITARRLEVHGGVAFLAVRQDAFVAGAERRLQPFGRWLAHDLGFARALVWRRHGAG